jgi:hypothetical protein
MNPAFLRQLHLWLALCDKIHTPQELADARAALDVAPRVRQARLPLDAGRGVA